MNGELKVSPEKLIQASGEFATSGNVVSGLTSQMTTMVTGLSGVWSGEAATAYRAKFGELNDDIARMNKMIQEHAQDLSDMARLYQQAETEATQASAGLPVDPIS